MTEETERADLLAPLGMLTAVGLAFIVGWCAPASEYRFQQRALHEVRRLTARAALICLRNEGLPQPGNCCRSKADAC